MEKFRDIMFLLGLASVASITRLFLDGKIHPWKKMLICFIRKTILATLAIMLGTGLITWLKIEPSSLFAQGILVLLGVYSLEILEYCGILLKKIFPAIGDRVLSFVNYKYEKDEDKN